MATTPMPPAVSAALFPASLPARPGAVSAPVISGANSPARNSARQAVVRYYSESGPDYAAWSSKFNMHFGYWVWGLNPFDREGMLERANQEVVERLGLDAASRRVIDLGCGLGATARFLAVRDPHVRVTGVTIVPWQIREARRLSAGQAIDFLEGDYCAVPCPDAAFDGAYAVESSCHAPTARRPDFVAEAYRVLKPGARLVVVDGFRKTDSPMSSWLGRIYDEVRRCWVLEDVPLLTDFVGSLRAAGFVDIRVEEASWRIAPSVAHVPLVSLRFLLKTGLRGLSEQRWNNVLGPLLMIILGAAHHRFGHYYITARKPTR
jgi:MPBQ/MSBQ methyltransferase